MAMDPMWDDYDELSLGRHPTLPHRSSLLGIDNKLEVSFCGDQASRVFKHSFGLS